jgi:hypothetical protein
MAHLQFDPKWNNLSSYAHGQLRLEQAKLAIAYRVGSRYFYGKKPAVRCQEKTVKITGNRKLRENC